jgi:hypothetical protein
MPVAYSITLKAMFTAVLSTPASQQTSYGGGLGTINEAFPPRLMQVGLKLSWVMCTHDEESNGYRACRSSPDYRLKLSF